MPDWMDGCFHAHKRTKEKQGRTLSSTGVILYSTIVQYETKEKYESLDLPLLTSFFQFFF